MPKQQRQLGKPRSSCEKPLQSRKEQESPIERANKTTVRAVAANQLSWPELASFSYVSEKDAYLPTADRPDF